MKKFVKVLSVVLVCVICIGSLSGCSNQPKLTTADEIAQALNEAGYTEAHVTDDIIDTSVYLSSSDEPLSEHINFASLYISEGIDNLEEKENYRYVASSDKHWYSFGIEYIDVDKDYSKVLDTVMPFFDSEYGNNGLEIMNQLWEYEKNSEFDYVNGDRHTTKYITYERDKYTVSYYLRNLSNGHFIIEIDIRDV